MASHFLQELKERTNSPITKRTLERLLCFALACWTFGQIVFVHSLVREATWVVVYQVGQFHAAIAFGCLIAVLASRSFRLSGVAFVILFLLLFGALTVWRRRGDNTLLAIVLFVIAAHGMRLDRLIWCYVFAALAGICCVFILSLVPLAQSNLVSVLGFTVFTCGFNELMTPACLLLGVLSALCLVIRGKLPSIVLASACIVCAIFTFIVLDVSRSALFMLVLGAASLFCAMRPKLAGSIARQRLTPLVVAMLPIVLFLVGSDLSTFYNIGDGLLAKGAYSYWVHGYGYVSTICLAVLFLGIAFRRRISDYRLMFFVVLALYGFFLAFDPLPARLECNVSLLLLTLGLDNQFFEAVAESNTVSQILEIETEGVDSDA